MKDEKDLEKMKIQEAFFKMLGPKAAVRILQYLGTEEKDNYDKTHHGSSPPTNLVQEIMRDLDSDYQRFK